MKHTLFSLLALLLFTPTFVACDSDDLDDDDETVAATVIADADLSTLEAAVIEADLDDDLAAADGTYTVFAPTDAAFTALLSDLNASQSELLAREDLGSILQLHVVATSELGAADLSAGSTVTTLNGQTLTVVSTGTGLGLDTEDADSDADAMLMTTDIMASNGVVHTIDTVLLPESD